MIYHSIENNKIINMIIPIGGIIMVSKIIITTFLLLSFNSFAERCSLERDQTLKIGCTTKCKYFYKKALKRFARKKGYRLQILDLSQNPEEYNLSKVDGIVIPGGADIDPKYYKNKVEPELRNHIERLDYLVDYSKEGERRDPFEYGLLKRYFSDPNTKDLPLLGICRGMQMLAVSQGVPLYIDIKEELGIKNRRYLLDKVKITDRYSLLKSILKYNQFRGYKYHHQGIRVNYFKKHKQERWPHLKLTSFSNRGKIAESLEFEGRPILGTQFHPEIDFWTERKRIFSWLLNESCKNKKLKKSTY